MLESLCNERDIDKISDYITDTEYNSHISGQRNDDHGVDAFFIDDEAFVSTKLVNCIMSDSTVGLEGKLRSYVTSANERFNGNDV